MTWVVTQSDTLQFKPLVLANIITFSFGISAINDTVQASISDTQSSKFLGKKYRNGTIFARKK